MKIICYTNLDLSSEVWPDALPALPAIGHKIQSRVKHDNFQLELQVVEITWKYIEKEYIPHIELHMCDWHKLLPGDSDPKFGDGSVLAFYKWYAPLVGKTMSSFV